MPDTLRLSLAAALILLGALVCGLNAWSVITSRRTGRFHSAVPLVGALFLGAGLFVLPATRPFCWAAVLVDYGTLELLRAVPRLVRELRATSARNLQHEFRAADGPVTVSVRLYRGRVFVLRLEIPRPPGEPGLTGRGATGTWHRDGDRLILVDSRESTPLQLAPDPASASTAFRVTASFPTWETDPASSLTRFHFTPHSPPE